MDLYADLQMTMQWVSGKCTIVKDACCGYMLSLLLSWDHEYGEKDIMFVGQGIHPVSRFLRSLPKR